MIKQAEERRTISDVRRSIRAPYVVSAKLEIIGGTKRGKPLLARTIDASAWGLRLESEHRIAEQTALRIWLKAPNRQEIVVDGYVRNTSCSGDGVFQAGIEFDQMQPQLSATLIDAAAYGQ